MGSERPWMARETSGTEKEEKIQYSQEDYLCLSLN